MKMHHYAQLLFLLEECKTTPDSPDPNKKCHFPFVYNNVTHHRCTVYIDRTNQVCATEDSPTFFADGKWGECHWKCPDEQCTKTLISESHNLNV